MNETAVNWDVDFSTDWNIITRAYDVQEAAAAAVLAERRRWEGLYTLTDWDKADEPGFKAREKDPWSESIAPYPPDPYDVDQVAEVPLHFWWLADRDPADLADKFAYLHRAVERLNFNTPGGITNLIGLLGENRSFRGETADQFVTFLGNMIDAGENQGSLGTELADAVATMNGFLTAARDDVNSIADETIKALKQIEEGEDNGLGAEMAFTLLGAAVGVLGAGVAGLGWALAGGLVSVAATAYSSSKPSGPTVEEVLEDMFTELGERDKELTKRDDKLVEALQYDDGVADRQRKKLLGEHGLTDRRPQLFEERGDLDAAGTALAIDLKETYRYATQAVPDMAGDFEYASTQIMSSIGSGREAMGPAAEPWDQLCTKLNRFSAITSNRLYDGGENLAKAVQDFAEQDGVNADWVEQPVKNHDGPTVPNPYTPPDDRPWMDRPKGEWGQPRD